jgi:hypothetical protein
MIPYTAVFTAFGALLLVLLATRVSLLRMRHKVSLGDGGNSELQRAMRAHGNTAEHVPIFLLLSAAYELMQGSLQFLLAAGVVFLAARFTYAWGMFSKSLTKRRQIAAGVTALAQTALAIALLIRLGSSGS